MTLLGGCRGAGRECPPIGQWLEEVGHLWKVRARGSTLPVGTEIMSFFGGKGGEIFMDMQGSFTEAPSVREQGREGVRHAG